MKKVLGILAIVGLAPLLMGAGITLDSSTPNPDGAAGKLKGAGTKTLNAGQTWAGIEYWATLKGSNPPQSTMVSDAVDPGGNWTETLNLVPGTYKPTKAVLNFTFMVMPQSVSIEVGTREYVVK